MKRLTMTGRAWVNLLTLFVFAIAGAVYAANEITAAVQLTATKGTLAVRRESGAKQITMTGDAIYHNVQVVGTTYEPVTIPGDIGTPGFSYWQNHGTNTVYIGGSTSNRLMTLKTGEFALFRLGTASWTLASAGGSCAVEYLIVEE